MGPPTRRIVAKQALELEVNSELIKKHPRGGRYRTQEKLMLVKQFEPQVPRSQLCQWLDLPRSVSYYQPRSGKPGAKPSQVTLKHDGTWVPNEQVITRIRQWLDEEFNAYGYEYATHELKTDFVINKKNGVARASISAHE